MIDYTDGMRRLYKKQRLIEFDADTCKNKNDREFLQREAVCKVISLPTFGFFVKEKWNPRTQKILLILTRARCYRCPDNLIILGYRNKQNHYFRLQFNQLLLLPVFTEKKKICQLYDRLILATTLRMVGISPVSVSTAASCKRWPQRQSCCWLVAPNRPTEPGSYAAQWAEWSC